MFFMMSYFNEVYNRKDFYTLPKTRVIQISIENNLFSSEPGTGNVTTGESDFGEDMTLEINF